MEIQQSKDISINMKYNSFYKAMQLRDKKDITIKLN